MKKQTALIIILIISIAGLLFSGYLSYGELFAAILKSICFGVLVSVVSCYYGLHVKRAMTEIPVAASQAVMRSLLVVFACDGILTVLLF